MYKFIVCKLSAFIEVSFPRRVFFYDCHRVKSKKNKKDSYLTDYSRNYSIGIKRFNHIIESFAWSKIVTFEFRIVI